MALAPVLHNSQQLPTLPMFASTLRAARIPRVNARAFSVTPLRFVSVGDKVPKVTLFEGSPGNEVVLADEAAKGKSIIIGVPGAFSPACSASHVPGFIKHLRAFNDKGFTSFYIVGVNDAFVMKAWADSLLADNVGSDQVRFLADPKGEFAAELDLLFDASKFFGNERSKRYALVVEDGEVTQTFVEPDNVSVDVSSAESLLEKDV